MTNQDFSARYGPWAIVTGASSGIGKALATGLAQRGLSVVLIARRQTLLTDISEHLAERYGISTRILSVDLTSPDSFATVNHETRDLDIGLLINNAGREDSGQFVETDPEEALLTLDLNVRAPLLLTHHFANRLLQRGKGGLVFMSSIVAFQGVATVANYAATKAYDLIFAEGIAAELEPHGVDVLAAAPGFTATDLSPDFDFSGTPIKPMPADYVAKSILDNLGSSRLVVPGTINKLLYYSGKFLLPRHMNTGSFGRVFKAVLRKKLAATRTRGLRSAA